LPFALIDPTAAGRFCAEMEVTLQAEDADDWAYKREGATSFLLSYTGSSPSMVYSVSCAC
jgi:hypothetical protein